MTTKYPRTAAVIPARYASTRFPGKPLALIDGKPMIQWVYERAAASAAAHVVVATDDDRILACVNGFGGRAAMTSPKHPTGTDRIAEVIREMDVDVVLNVQGDEPFVPPELLSALLARMIEAPQIEMGTIAVAISSSDADFQSPDVVKVVLDARGNALYFSRAPIPFPRDGDVPGVSPLRHWGIYAFRKTFVNQFVAWPQGRLEQCEKLEQLRALENGATITVLVTERDTVAVDLPSDVARAEAFLARNRARITREP